MIAGQPCWACGRLVPFEKASSISMHACNDGGRATFSVDVCERCFGATLDFMKRRREHIRKQRAARAPAAQVAARPRPTLPKGGKS